jgi:hypothetical protein
MQIEQIEQIFIKNESVKFVDKTTKLKYPLCVLRAFVRKLEKQKRQLPKKDVLRFQSTMVRLDKMC